MRFNVMAIFLAMGISQSSLAINFPTPGSDALAVSTERQDFSDYDFTGIVALSNCSGSLVRFDDSEGDDFGMILTNGHCVQMMNPGRVIVGVSSSKSFTFLSPSGSRLGSARAQKLLYATMTNTDMALYQLTSTFDELTERFDVVPLTLSRDYPEVGDAIEIISGYWKRGYSCEVEKIVYSLKEDDWLFKDSIRYSRPGCSVIGGTSGSPAILSGTRTVIGVNNTINERGRRCAINNPCEIDEDGEIFYERGIGYAQQTSWVYSCRSEIGALDLNQKGCLLPQ